MRVSYEWLCELAGIRDVSPRRAADVLTMAGWNVEEIQLVDRSSLVVGRVLAQEPHPGSRKPLWVHQVDLGDHTRQVIAGVDNARPGALVPVALPGTTVPDGTLVRDAMIAGVAGRGMLCSEAELQISDDHNSILLLDGGRPGQPLTELIPSDAIFEVEVTPNRPDCLGHLGLARELAAALGRSLGRDFMPPFTGGVEPPGTDLVGVEIEAPDLCRRYIGAPITGVRVGQSPLWLRRRLWAAGVRPISNVVDVTNYVALEYGQPLHAFDLARIGGRRIVVRRARAGETLLCLDGEGRLMTPDMLVIADAERPVAVAGIIGGEESAVSESTTDLLLEAANFEGVSVRATSRALRLRTEASTRFEKGLSPELALAGARRAAMLLAELTGGRVHVGWADCYPRPQEPSRVRFRPQQIDGVLGVHVPLQEMEAILRRLDFGVRVGEDGEWDVLPPVFRLDVSIPEDVAEEVGRMHGYDRVPATLPGARRTSWQPARASLERRLDPVRHALAAAGHTEVVTPALVAGSLLDALGVGEAAMRLLNPVADDQDVLRTTLLPSLLQVAVYNRNLGRPAVAVFELGRAYLRRPDDPLGQPDEPVRLAALRTGLPGPDAGRVAFRELKGALGLALDVLTPVVPVYERAEAPLFHPGRCARVLVCGRPLGHVGELHPAVVERFDLDGRAVALELAVEPVLALDLARRARPLPRFPAVNRDLGVVVDEGVDAGALQRTIKEAAGDLLDSAAAFDEYRGSQVPAGRKSVAFALTFRSPERTLTDAEVDGRMDAIRAALNREHGAAFRGEAG
ncbi:MAG TPA: phenylalanine--tRNA ligase subunit beta [Candidatus Dormibacteraeota bacterium]|nr:phenylalanine--tRNA ligase subunit beta [Candidatus Dormibacteraeota bacterium]